MMNYQKLVKIANDDWESVPKLAYACERFIDAIKENNPSALHHMTFSTIKDLIDLDLNSTEVVRVTQYLCGEKLQLLEAGFEYITDEESFILDEDNCYYAFSENAIAHPETGNLISDVKKDIYMFFNLIEVSQSEY
ncbi:hypothetical protein [Pseudoalteromonas sp. ND6B]|uniref:hypothetical protein n=1 Tax=Pseudoalteromonas sp. ND6B TaxID=1535421 RepID=UPI00051DDCE0|nr:hypothetical protein [Pseudoalteromonas sp. ND6B]KGK02586.1 hypothetical protein ND6B_0762 [Pseudoalteromonas sp. ND6B]